MISIPLFDNHAGMAHANIHTTSILALIAFAANSVLGRIALGPGAIDPASYSTIRLASGALAIGELFCEENRRWTLSSFV